MINDDASLPDDIFAASPGIEALMSHTVSVDAERWRRALAERNLPPLTGKLAAAGLTTVSRKEVFDLGSQRRTAQNAFQLLYYSLAWGLGTKASRLHQRLDGLASNQEQAEALLVSAWTAVEESAPTQDAYSILTTDRGAGRIAWLGPAFSTKFLYFAQGPTRHPSFVILDQVVSANLHRDAWPNASPAAWWPKTYARYCQLLGQWAEQATERLDGARRVRPDEIELALFRR